MRRAPTSPLSPYTTLFRSLPAILGGFEVERIARHVRAEPLEAGEHRVERLAIERGWIGLDRKSTRLNSSHPSISYAVFCLKKKNMDQADTLTLISDIPAYA